MSMFDRCPRCAMPPPERTIRNPARVTTLPANFGRDRGNGPFSDMNPMRTGARTVGALGWLMPRIMPLADPLACPSREIHKYPGPMDAKQGAYRLLRTKMALRHRVPNAVVMPGRSDKELVCRIKAARTCIAALHSSGHAGNAIVHRGALDTGVAFLHKQVARRLREMINSSGLLRFRQIPPIPDGMTRPFALTEPRIIQ